MKKHVYLIPGMSASSLIFERIHFPKEDYHVHSLEWLLPLSKNEPLEQYVTRFAKLITEPNPILIGVSFGGIIAQELGKTIDNSKVIIISSIKHEQEQRPLFQFLRKTKLYRLYSPNFVNTLEKLTYQLAPKKIKNSLILYRKYLPVRNPIYTQWAIRTFLNWQQSKNQNIMHFHGDKDPILPVQYLSNFKVIPKGTHAMILTQSTILQREILRSLA
ncbi:alpha/beta hydrolase [Wenyingzhuangia sp. 1_MG-2023]|nr:alpha/beta hydrolase [Wenyingzhuangia sp. 1_MG-2023]